MVEFDFVIEDWDTFVSFVQERPIVYKFMTVRDVVVGLNIKKEFYAVMLASQRIAYKEHVDNDKEIETKVKILEEFDFVKGRFERVV